MPHHARSPARVLPGGHVLAVDRSAKATRELLDAGDLIENGVLSVRTVACEDLALDPDEKPYDLAFAVRVGGFDGRHPTVGERALAQIAHALGSGGQLFIDGGNPLREVPLPAPP